jgi:hypothetical protein
MAKKKISTDDFLQLLDNQESSTEKPAFRPRARAPEPKLGPVQKEWLDLAMKKAPRLTRFAAALVGRIRK